MENYESKINRLIRAYYDDAKNLKIVILAGIDGKSKIISDYSGHSVKAYLWDEEDIDFYMNVLQNDGVYAAAHYDFQDFLKKYTADSLYVKPNLIFESSFFPSVFKTRDQIIPSFCDYVGIKHLGSGATANALCCNKYLWNQYFASHGIPVPRSHLYNGKEWLTPPDPTKKYLLKLNFECASIGITQNSLIESNVEKLTEQAEFLYGTYLQPVIAQEFISGHEVETPFLVNSEFSLVLPPIELLSHEKGFLADSFLNYDKRFQDDYLFERFDLHHATESSKIKNYIKKAIDLCGLDGYMRLDCRVNERGEIYFFDFNNDPAINEKSSFAKSMAAFGYGPADVLRAIIGNALIRPKL